MFLKVIANHSMNKFTQVAYHICRLMFKIILSDILISPILIMLPIPKYLFKFSLYQNTLNTLRLLIKLFTFRCLKINRLYIIYKYIYPHYISCIIFYNKWCENFYSLVYKLSIRWLRNKLLKLLKYIPTILLIII